MPTDFDDVLRDIGDYGKYQKIVMWTLLFPLCIPSGIHWFNQIFMQGIPEHRCFIPEMHSPNIPLFHYAVEDFIPLETQIDGSREPSRCTMFAREPAGSLPEFSTNTESGPFLSDSSNFTIVPCLFGWNYNDEHYTKTVVTDWDLVCDLALAPTIAFAVFGVGNLVGVFFFGSISDRFGRKKGMFFLLAVQTVFGGLSAVAPNIGSWMFFRCTLTVL
jgi:hypothetical protein